MTTETTIATFDNTVGILVKAYLDGTLASGICSACAVGNICATAAGTKVLQGVNGGWGWAQGGPLWDDVFYTGCGIQSYAAEYYQGDTKEQIDATGYTWQDLAKIEHAFEIASNWAGDDTDETRLVRLMAVVDVLADIHGIDLTTATAAKALFVRA